MRKFFAKIFVPILTMTLLFSTLTNAATKRFSLHEIASVTSLLQQLGESGDFSNIKILKDYDNSDRYYYLPFSTDGYLIYDRDLDIIHEYSTESRNVTIETYNNLYYGGALLYCSLNEDSFYDVSTKEKIGTQHNLIQSISATKNSMLLKKATPTSVRANTTVKISGTVPNYSYNPNGICGSTAAAMLLRWYDLNVNNKYVPSTLESNTGISLIQYLVPYIERNTRESKPGDLYTGIQEYCSDRKVYHSGGMEVISSNYIIGRVSSDEVPYIMGLRSSSSYGAHWVTGYGYTISGSNFYAIVNDGHGSTNVSINIVNGDFIVW